MNAKRRSFLSEVFAKTAALLGLVMLWIPVRAAGKKPKRIEGGFMHMVFFWLRDPQNTVEKEEFEKELKFFTDNTPGILTRHIGTPAATDRPVIDNTWTYSLVLSFGSKKEHDAYQEHPLHKKFIDNAGHLWQKVLVYDSEII